MQFTEEMLNYLVSAIDCSKDEILSKTTVKTFETGTQAYVIDLPSWWIYYYPKDEYFMIINCFGFKGFGKTLDDAHNDLDRRLDNRIANCA